jgi:tetratricopeptide (TPR) repeat protein
VELDPVATFSHLALAQALHRIGRRDEARRELARAIEISPDYLPPRVQSIRIDLDEGKTAAAIAAARSLADTNPNATTLSILGVSLARGGRTDEARAVLARLDGIPPERRRSAIPRASLASALGLREQALAGVRAAIDARDFRVPTLLYSDATEFGNLAGDPEYEKLMAEIRGGQ